MATIQELMLDRPRPLWTVSAAASARSALDLMVERDVGCLPVLDAGQFVGVVTEREFVRRCCAGAAAAAMTVGEIMSRPVVVASPAHSAEACLALMIDRDVRHLPVVENARLVAILSLRDVTDALLSEGAFSDERPGTSR